MPYFSIKGIVIAITHCNLPGDKLCMRRHCKHLPLLCLNRFYTWTEESSLIVIVPEDTKILLTLPSFSYTVTTPGFNTAEKQIKTVKNMTRVNNYSTIILCPH